ncbi:MAG TPA: hypothetical protein VEY10_00115 [Flavisolibacter sp.]|nr:hypothetical protein [Flavisolibacter sp.]
MITLKKTFNCSSCFTALSTIILCSLLLTSCLTAKKLDAEVAKVYGDKRVQKKRPSEQITITSTLTANGAALSNSETKTSVLPLIVYIGITYRNICKLNPQIPVTNFTSTVTSLANKGLMQKLQAQKLELSIDQIPTEFSFDDKGHMILLLVGWDNVSIQGKSTDMIVRYKLLGEGSTTAKQGVITVPYPNDKMNLGYFKSWKKATSEYLGQYDANITAMSKVFVDKLVKEL